MAYREDLDGVSVESWTRTIEMESARFAHENTRDKRTVELLAESELGVPIHLAEMKLVDLMKGEEFAEAVETHLIGVALPWVVEEHEIRAVYVVFESGCKFVVPIDDSDEESQDAFSAIFTPSPGKVLNIPVNQGQGMERHIISCLPGNHEAVLSDDDDTCTPEELVSILRASEEAPLVASNWRNDEQLRLAAVREQHDQTTEALLRGLGRIGLQIPSEA